MAKRAATSDVLKKAKATYKRPSRSKAIDTSDADIREFCEEVRREVQAGTLGDVSLAHIYREGSKAFDGRLKFGLSTFQNYVRANG